MIHLRNIILSTENPAEYNLALSLKKNYIFINLSVLIFIPEETLSCPGIETFEKILKFLI